MDLTPLVLFTYNRPWHTRQTIQALQKNDLAQESNLYIYSDAPKTLESRPHVAEIRKYLKTIEGFGRVIIVEREHNYGLAANIIDGVTTVASKYGKVIVLEDDILTNQHFLTFMNDALCSFEAEKQVMHISGWNYPINPNGLPEHFLWRVMNCWGWATWADRWQYFNRDPEELINSWSKEDIRRFNLDDAHNFWSQVVGNVEGQLNTWAVFWYASIFKKGGLCLNPTRTLVQNIGHDGSGMNCGRKNAPDSKPENYKPIVSKTELLENRLAVERIKVYLKETKPSLVRRAAGRIKRVICK